MDVEVVKVLMQAFKETELTKFSLKCDEFELKLSKEHTALSLEKTLDPRVSVMPEYMTSNLGAANVSRLQGTVESAVEGENSQEKALVKTIKAPIVGTFYLAESPNAKPLVEVGSYVHKGDVVCIIEAMKLMNEVEAEEEGEVVEILIENEEMVEYNQPLIVLK